MVIYDEAIAVADSKVDRELDSDAAVPKVPGVPRGSAVREWHLGEEDLPWHAQPDAL